MNNIQVFKIKRNDTLPVLQVNIGTRGNLGQKIGYDLTNVVASAITFTMIDNCSNTKVYAKPAQIICVSGGTIQYSWEEGDTDTEGIYFGEFELIFNTGQKLSIPTQGGIKIEILKDINSF
jgi:hypothetical protein